MKILRVTSELEAIERLAQSVGASGFPAQLDLNNFEKIQQYTHASSAPWKVRDKTTGAFYILKKERGNTPGHLSNESDLENYARGVGMKVPASKLYKTPQGVFKLSQFVEGKLLKDLSGPAKEQAVKQTHNSFLAHALLGNADMYGMFRDNVLIDSSGTPWFIDLGGGGPYRAMGEKKPSSRWNDQPGEVDSMRSGPYANPELTSLTDDHLRQQFSGIAGGHEQALNALKDPATRDMVNRRFQNLKKRFGQSVMASSKVAGLSTGTLPPPPEQGTSPLAGRMDKYLQDAHQWQLKDLTPDEQKRLFDINTKSYQDAKQTAFPFDKWMQYAQHGSTPWEFLGDKGRTGYVTIKKVPRIPMDIYKLTATAGDKKGKFAGMAQVLKSDKPIFGAVSQELYDMAVRVGFHPLSAQEVNSLMSLPFNIVGGDMGGKPTVGPSGELNINHNVAGKVTKRMICNEPFKQLLAQFKGKANFQSMYGMFGKGF